MIWAAGCWRKEWCRQRLFQRPATSKSLTQGFQETIGAGVSRLRYSCCPSAIRRPAIREALLAMAARIVAVVVDSVDAVFRRRALSHVGVKICELLPSFTDNDPAPVSVRAFAHPVHHGFPGDLLRAPIQAVDGTPGDCLLCGVAPATVRPPANQRRCSNRTLGAALALTEPVGVSVSDGFEPDDGPAIEPLSSQVFSASAGRLTICLSHDVTLPKELRMVRAGRRYRACSGSLHFSR